MLSGKLLGLVKYIYLLLIISIVATIICFDYIDVPYKKQHFIPNWAVILIIAIVSILILTAAILISRKHPVLFDRIIIFINNNYVIILGSASIIVFLIQLIISWNFYFKTGWDVGFLTSYAMSMQKSASIHDYFSTNPNNLFLSFLFSIIIKLANIIGIDPYFGLIIFGNFLVNISSVLTSLIIFEYTKNKILGILSLCIFIQWIALSPWIVIPYSETYGVIFPIISLYLYIKEKLIGSNNYFRVFMIGLTATLGYLIKPTTIIVFIAIIIAEIFELFSRTDSNRKGVIINIVIILLSISAILFLHSNLKAGFGIDKEKSLGPFHYVMMGLNAESSGGYSKEDKLFSMSFGTKEERKKGNISVIKQRIENYGLDGLVKHFIRKALINFNDGSFAWENEGNFYLEVYEERSVALTSLLRDFYSSHWDNDNSLFLQFTQNIWLWVLTFSLGFFITKQYRDLSYVSIDNTLYLSIIGFVLFVMLFEARARYLFIFAPIFIICAFIGLERIYKLFSLRFFHPN